MEGDRKYKELEEREKIRQREERMRMGMDKEIEI